jgi:hypothetical protein
MKLLYKPFGALITALAGLAASRFTSVCGAG